jgi:hypothetical protein
MKHFLLIKREGFDALGGRLTAQESATALLAAGIWPLWEHTRNRLAMKAGDRVAVYLSGDGGCRVIATADVKTIGQWDRTSAKSYPLALDGIPFSVLHLDDVKLLDNPVEVKARLAKLSFINHGSPKWGVAFMGGTRALGAADFNTLTR